MLAEPIYNLMTPDMLEDIDVALLLKDTAIVQIYIKLPVIGKPVNL